MINVAIPILGELHANTLMYIVNLIFGWFVIERIRLFIKCAKTKHQWKQQQGRQ